MFYYSRAEEGVPPPGESVILLSFVCSVGPQQIGQCDLLGKVRGKNNDWDGLMRKPQAPGELGEGVLKKAPLVEAKLIPEGIVSKKKRWRSPGARVVSQAEGNVAGSRAIGIYDELDLF